MAAAKPPPIADMVRIPEFVSASISPDGKYLALAAPADQQTGLAILDISGYPKLKLASAFKLPAHEHVYEITWANKERVLFTTMVQRGTLNMPWPTGRLYAINADGSNRRSLYGTNFQSDWVFNYFDIIDLLHDEPDWILISTYAHDRDRPIATRININNGRQDRGIGSPLDNGALYADSRGVVRFAAGGTDELKRRIAYRASADSKWTELEVAREDNEMGVYGFNNGDDAVLVARDIPGKMGLYELAPSTGEFSPLLLNANVEPGNALSEIGVSKRTVGAVFEDGIPRNHFIDENEPSARLYRMLEEAFPGMHVSITSATHDGKKALVAVNSDRQPTQFYLFDVAARQLAYLVGTRSWIDAKAMAERRPIHFTARDGRRIHGYLTLPPGSKPENLPMVVVVHGGPHGPRDTWSWDMDAQLLATRGYAVLQVNFRGSGGYGREFETAGYRNWGTAIQDDVTDGTRWAVSEGIADAERLCIYGGSFGGYSVLQSMTRESELYKCGFAFVGIYDMELMFKKGDIPETKRGQNYLKKVLGTDENVLREHSPIHHLDQLKGALYVAHGKEDVRAHVEHYYQLIKALEAKDIPHKKLLVKNEGHGFYEQKNREKLYTELVDFIDAHIGGKQ